MDVNGKLMAHLVHIVAPLGVPLTGAQLTELCSKADRAQREAAVDRARIKSPFLLPDEEHEAADWIVEATAAGEGQDG